MKSRAAIAKAMLALAPFMVMGTNAQANDAAELRPCLDQGQVQKALQLINDMRARGAPCLQRGLSVGKALVWEGHLAATAGEQASDLALRDEISHFDAKQRSFKMRLAQSGYNARAAGENLAVGQADFATTLQSWLDSPVHCATLMTPAYTEVGLACVERQGSRYERFWVAHLGQPNLSAPKAKR